MHHFQLIALPPTPFTPLFTLSDQALAQHGAQRHIATANTGYPCRISHEDAKQGDELLLLPYLPAPTRRQPLPRLRPDLRAPRRHAARAACR